MRFAAVVILAAAALALGTTPSDALAAPAKQSSAKSKKSVKSSKSPGKSAKAEDKAAAAPVAEPEAPSERLSDVQLVLATMVQTGQADCEFDQKVLVEPNERQLGGFLLKFGKASYTMVPEQTSTGTIRLVDDRSGVAWLQIRYKSMLMNTKAGQRMVDACSLPAQRLAEADAVRILRAESENPAAAAASASDPHKELPLLKN